MKTNMKGNLLRKTASLFLLIPLLLSSSAGMAAGRVRAAVSCSLEQAGTLAEENSEGVRDVSIDLVKKQIELKQAKDAIKDIRKKESTVRFSLLFNLKFPEKHGLPKEIELIMKVPELNGDIAVLQRKKTQEALVSRTAGRTVYYDVLLGQYLADFYEQKTKEARIVQEKIGLQYKLGTGSKEDYEYAQIQTEQYEKKQTAALLDFVQAKEKLSSLTGLDLKYTEDFGQELPDLTLTREKLPEITEYSLEHDYELYEAEKALEYAEREVAELLGIYKNKYGNYMNAVESYLKTHSGSEIDYEEFILLYNDALIAFDSPWSGAYVINLLFFKIRIPKEWFKGEYSGTRYLEDQKYALFVALVDREKAEKRVESVKNALVQSIKESYRVLKQMQTSRAEAEENLKQGEAAYEKALSANRKGTASFSGLEAAKASLYAQQASLYEARIEYAKALESLNETTSGYIGRLLERKAGAADGTYESGDSRVEETDEEDEGEGDGGGTGGSSGTSSGTQAEWYLNPDESGYHFLFGVIIPEEYGVDSYELWYNGNVVGERLPVTRQLVHLSIAYEDSTLMELKFYEDDEQRYTSYFDGASYGGTLVMTPVKESKNPVSEPDAGTALGQWSFLMRDAVRGEFSFAVNGEIDYDSFQISFREQKLFEGKKGESITTLALYFGKAEQIEITLFRGKAALYRMRLVATEEGMGNLVVSELLQTGDIR